MSVSTPARNAKGEPHPGRRTIIIANTSHGRMDSASPTFPIVAFFSFSIGMTPLSQTWVKQTAGQPLRL